MVCHNFVPQTFICAKIIPIPKGSKPALTCSDKYRSIANQFSFQLIECVNRVFLPTDNKNIRLQRYRFPINACSLAPYQKQETISSGGRLHL